MIKPEDQNPDLGPFDFYMLAFGELGSCRQIGMAVGPIPFTAIVEYSRLYDVGDFERFLYLIRRMDAEFLRLQMAKQDSKTSSKPPENVDGKRKFSSKN